MPNAPDSGTAMVSERRGRNTKRNSIRRDPPAVTDMRAGSPGTSN
jgi:hypothetical protein